MIFRPSNLQQSIAKALAITTCLSLSVVANAQEETEKEKGLETITVTAQKRVENLNEVPVLTLIHI